MSIKKVIIILMILAVGGGAAIYFATKEDSEFIYTTALVEKGQLVQTVSETGIVKASSEIDLSFLNTGNIQKMHMEIGDKVEKGALLAGLDYSSLTISQEESQANLDITKENLNKLLAGATTEEIAVAKANVSQAKASHESAQKELAKTKETAAENIAQAEKTLSDLKLETTNDVTTYEQAISAAETSLSNTKATYQRSIDNYKETALITIDDNLAKANTALDTIDRTINDEDGEDNISIENLTYLVNTQNTYNQALVILVTANSSLTTAKEDDNNNATEAVNNAILVLNKVFESLQNCYNALENSVTSSTFTQSELDTLKTNISTKQTTIGTAVSSVQSAKQNLDDAILDYNTNVSSAKDNLAKAQAAYDNAMINARNGLATAEISGEQKITAAESKVDSALEAWQVAQAQLNKTIAAANKHDIALSRAKIRQAQAALDAINKRIENSLIKASISGTITKIEYEVGEQVSAGLPVISMLGENDFEIEVDVSEADIAKVNKNNLVEVTLDAFGDDVKFSGQVYFIEPAETVIQDVIYYKVKINFDVGEKAVKSGMTANVIITTAEKDNVLIMPSRAVVERNSGEKYARVLINNQVLEKSITVGLRGDEGMIEILSGVKEGENVVTNIKEK